MTQKRMQLSVFAVAALAIVAVAAVMLLAGGGSARADTASLAPDSGGMDLRPMQQATTPTPTPRFPNPEPCPGKAGNPNTESAAAVDSGHIALFDVWWNTEEGELTNTSCPPTVTHVPAQTGRGGHPARDDRYPSSINIAETVIHIPNSAKVTLTETAYPKAQYQALWDADDAENPDGDGDRIVWALPACPPEGTPPTGGLCLSFSAALLNGADWRPIDPDGNGGIVYHVDHVHQVDIDKQEDRYVLVYEGISGGNKLRWNSYDASKSEMPVAAGSYDRPKWFFTSRGSYEFQVHITGEPNQDLDNPVSENPRVNSDVREYVLHVGAEADLGITTMEVTPASPSPGNSVTVRITANNAGPDEAQKTKVGVSLPEGLTYSSHVAPSGTSYESGVWTVNNLANEASKTLTLTATVDAGTLGNELAVQSTISATETVLEEYEVPVLDPSPSNEMRTRTITVASSANVNPVFGIERSVAENTSAGTSVGPRIVVKDPDTGDPQTPTLVGDGAGKFTVSLVDGGAQIAVASGASLDHECRGRYSLTLQVSDGKDGAGNSDTATDDTIPLDVLITNDVSDDPSLTFALDSISAQGTAFMSVTHTPSNLGRPDCQDRFSFWEYQFLELVNGEWVVESDDDLDPRFEYTAASGDSHTFRVDLVGTRHDASEFRRISSNTITVNWP